MDSFINYVGGKSKLVEKIIPIIPEHKCYCEVFSGAAWLFFKKDKSKVEIINDVNCELITLYRVIQHHPEEFFRYISFMIPSRDEFKRLYTENPKSLTDIQRATRIYYIIRLSYGGKIHNPTFSTSSSKRVNFNLETLQSRLPIIHDRLSKVVIENLDYCDCIKKYDSNQTFFYLDPPYFRKESLYGRNIFNKEDYPKMCQILEEIRGKFILSINNVNEIRDVFKNFIIKEVFTYYTIGKGKTRRKKELLILNF